MRNICDIRRLFQILEADDFPKQVKVDQIKMAMRNGDITEDEAIDLAVEFFTR